MAYDKVIIFGPTGNIGSITAQTASKKGADVYLAMRDPSKAIPGLTKEAEQSGKYERIKADLSAADSVRSAVEKTGAEAAFLYLVHGSEDHMLATFQALKDGGIKNVVFLSSYTVPREKMEDVLPEDIISFMHTQAEVKLRSVFAKEQLVTLRPGYFATNVIMQHKKGISEKKVKLLAPERTYDMITNEDMGEVAGTVLVEGQRDGESFIYLMGPEMVVEDDAFKIVSKVLGVKIETVKVDADEGLQEFVREGLPVPISKYLVKIMLEDTLYGSDAFKAGDGTLEEGNKNVEKYTGHPALKFEEWATRNKHMFA
jgi:uncharacterized protein YbjT (DUF2867 family)